MRPIFQAGLANGALGDPVLYVDFLFERRALLFDTGNLRALPARKLLRVSDLFVSHAHMDHFQDFDWLLRLLLGREQVLRVHGPAGILDRLEAKLRAYSWNLAGSYAAALSIEGTELHEDASRTGASFCLQEGFARRERPPQSLPPDVLIDEPALRVRAAVLDHDIPCLAYAVEEKTHVNVWKNRLAELGLAPGPWLRELKAAVLAGLPDETPVSTGAGDGTRTGSLPLGELRRRILRLVPGQKLGYVVDAAWTEANAARLLDLLAGTHRLFVESAFLQEDAPRAARRRHLTAHQAGTLARRAGVSELVTMHYSPRYEGRYHALREEALAAFRGTE